uniref:Odorant receptor n=1 Tax=Campoletis chlorideae TaxID=219166 RepID=A0A346D3W3_9HYME|nr:odorant receptor [Campoletis chlorideae]
MNSEETAGASEIGTRANEKDDSFGMDYSVRFVRWLLTPIGVWQLVKPNSSRLDQMIGYIVRPIALTYMFLVIIPMFAEVFAQRASRSELIMLVAPITYQSSNLMKHVFMMLRRDVIKMSMQHMEIDWQSIDNEKDRGIMIENVRLAHKLAIIITSCIYSGSTLYNFVLPALADSYVNEFNETIRVLSYPGGDIFFDVQANVVYEIVFVTYFLSALSVVTVSMGLFNLALILVRHTCGQIQIVVSKLENLVDPEQHAIVLNEDPVAFIVRSHQRLLKFSMEIEIILKEICAMEVICDTLALCFLGYCCITVYSNDDATTAINYVMMMVSVTTNLFLYCQIGEVLHEQCQDVGRAAYMIDWYKLPVRTSLDLIMIMNMSAKPRKLTAGGMMEISRASFTSIMKTSFAYLNMLRTMT